MQHNLRNKAIVLMSCYFPGCLESLHWKEGADSSGSETGKQELEDDFPLETHSISSVQFTVGDTYVLPFYFLFVIV